MILQIKYDYLMVQMPKYTRAYTVHVSDVINIFILTGDTPILT